MKKKTDFRPNYFPNQKRRPFRQRFISKLLCLCLIGAALPIEYYSLPVLAAQEQADTDPSYSDESENANDKENTEVTPEIDSKAEGTENENQNNSDLDSQTNLTDTVDPDENNSPKNPTDDTNDPSLPDTDANTDMNSVISADSDPTINNGDEIDSNDSSAPENIVSLQEDNTKDSDPDSQSLYYLAEFYSGNNEKEEIQAIIESPPNGSGNFTPPDLKPLDGWHPLGWMPDDFCDDWVNHVLAVRKPGQFQNIQRNTIYYGLYRKLVVFSLYYADGNSDGNMMNHYLIVFPDKAEEAVPIINLSIPSDSFVPANLTGYTFEGWSMSEDGNGPMCYAGETLQSEEDVTLYAKYTKPVTLTLYSGQAGQADTVPLTTSNLAHASYTLPTPEAMEGWTPIGWSKTTTGFNIDYQIGEQIELDNDLILYGIYEKNVTLAYDANGIGTAPPNVQKTFYANVNNASVSTNKTLFSIASALSSPDAAFQGWNTRPDEMGDPYTPGNSLELDSDLTLYAIWYLPNSAAYHVEHYLQDAEGEGYTKSDADTQRFRGTIGEETTASPKIFDGFIENTTHPNRETTGIIQADNSLVLCLYYDRYVVDVNFDLNGGSGNVPESQTLRQGSFLQKPADPIKDGYNFMGWYLDAEGTEGFQWDFGQPVEKNTLDTNVTLYAKWEDLTAPVLGDATISFGYKGLFHWIIQKKGITITVPITESGSGIREAHYFLIPENGTEKTGEALITTIHDDTNAAPDAQKIRIRIIDGQPAAQFTIDEEFKGTIAMTCTDNNNNVSPRKILTAEDGGVIIEDNAPEINFTAVNSGLTEGTASIDVSVEDDWNGNLSGGIGQISYWIDEQETAFPEELFTKEILESYSFTVDLSGTGTHALTVCAIDNAGNENTRQITVNITQPEPGVPGTPDGSEGGTPGGPEGGSGGSGNQTPENWNPGKPGIYNNFDNPAFAGNDIPGISDPELTDSKNLPREPRTGELTHVEIYATISMIAGFSYLLLYFTDGLNMTERKKNELVFRLVHWAKSGSRFRKAPALIAIFCLLAYYHSIGKYDEWEVGFWNLNGLSTR